MGKNVTFIPHLVTHFNQVVSFLHQQQLRVIIVEI